MQPAKRHAYAQAGDNGFTPVERELVFDVVSDSYSEELHPSYQEYNFSFIDTLALHLAPRISLITMMLDIAAQELMCVWTAGR